MRSFFQPILLIAIILAPFRTWTIDLSVSVLGVVWLVFALIEANRASAAEHQSAMSAATADAATGDADRKEIKATASSLSPSCSVPASSKLPNNDQLSRWDDAGVWLGSLWVLISGVVLSQLWPGNSFQSTPELYFWLPSMFLGVVIVAISYWFRRKEAQVMSVWRLVREHPDFDAEQLVHDSHLSRASLKRAVRYLNSSGRAFLEWDLDRNRIYDSRLNVKHDIVQNCAGCGSTISSRLCVRADQLPSCPYCHSPLQLDPMHQTRDHVVAEIREQNRLADERAALEDKAITPFSTILLVALFILCWPLIFFYLARYIPAGLRALNSLGSLEAASGEPITGWRVKLSPDRKGKRLVQHSVIDIGKGGRTIEIDTVDSE